MPWFVYVARCGDDTLYTGVTTDPARRERAHNRGLGAAYTRSRRPVRLLHVEPAAGRGAALRRELAIKRMTREQKEALVAGDGVAMRFRGFGPGALHFLRRLERNNRREWFERTVPTESLAVLQVRVRRRSNVGRGALIGAAVGLAAGAGCASEGGGWTNPEPGQCLVAGILGGAGYGALLGLLIRSDVWAPVLTPVEPASPRAVPPVTLLR